MKRILIDYKRLPREVAALLIETYPDGYGDDDIIAFESAKGEYIETVELRTSDTLYLVKISKSLSNFIANFDETIEKELDKEEKGNEMHDPETETGVFDLQDPEFEEDYDLD